MIYVYEKTVEFSTVFLLGIALYNIQKFCSIKRNFQKQIKSPATRETDFVLANHYITWYNNR